MAVRLGAFGSGAGGEVLIGAVLVVAAVATEFGR